MTPTVVIAAAFVGAAALAVGVALMLRSPSSSVAEERLELLTGAASAAKRGGSAQPSVLLQPLDETRGLAQAVLSRFGGLPRFLEQADSPLSASRLLALMGLCASAGALAVMLLGAPLALLPAGAAAAAALPLGWLAIRRKRRLAAFARQLPEALELISRALRAGHSLAAGFQLVGEEMDDPIGKEFLRCYEEQNFGIPLEEALEDMTRRVPNLDLRFFATSVSLQRQTGGDLAEILDKIGYLIRERFKIWGQIQALTGEGRLSGVVLLGLPPVLFLAMWKLNPDYCMILFQDPLGHKMLAVAAIMQIIGALVIRKIVNIKV